jgi:hypothetical protein
VSALSVSSVVDDGGADVVSDVGLGAAVRVGDGAGEECVVVGVADTSADDVEEPSSAAELEHEASASAAVIAIAPAPKIFTLIIPTGSS